MNPITRTATTNGTEILSRTWETDGDPRAAVLLVHGLGEHSGRYEHVGAGLAERGFLVRAFDLPGFGASGGARAYVDRFEVYLDHVEAQLDALAAHSIPIVLVGHSLGGLIGLAYVHSSRKRPDLLVASAPVLDASVPQLKKIAARVLSNIVPKLALSNPISSEQLSRDPAIGLAYFADPLVYTKTTTRLGAELLGAMESTRQANEAGLPIPTLVLHGANDTLVPTRSSEALEGVENVRRIVFADFRHESHNEDGGHVMIETLASWMGEQLGD